MTNPINATDDTARQLAQDLLHTARYGAIAVTHPDTQTPYAARVAMLWHDGALLTLRGHAQTYYHGDRTQEVRVSVCVCVCVYLCMCMCV